MIIHILLFNLRLSHKGKNEREEPKGIVFLSQLCKLCNETMSWKSQPHLLGKFPAGNIFLSFGILSAGASTTKFLRVFKHMGLLGYNQVTYYYQKILYSLNGKEVILAGDGMHDSLGHSAKYGTYTVFCCTIGLIIHIVLVQVAWCTNKF